jgi:isoprenylcysteine carboxyl methyltransferase (ICMT) family protein YpbQ
MKKSHYIFFLILSFLFTNRTLALTDSITHQFHIGVFGVYEFGANHTLLFHKENKCFSI